MWYKLQASFIYVQRVYTTRQFFLVLHAAHFEILIKHEKKVFIHRFGTDNIHRAGTIKALQRRTFSSTKERIIQHILTFHKAYMSSTVHFATLIFNFLLGVSKHHVIVTTSHRREFKILRQLDVFSVNFRVFNYLWRRFKKPCTLCIK